MTEDEARRESGMSSVADEGETPAQEYNKKYHINEPGYHQHAPIPEPTEICEDGPAKIVPMKPAVTDEGFEFLAGMQGKGWLVAHKHTHDAKDSEVMVVFLSRKK